MGANDTESNEYDIWRDFLQTDSLNCWIDIDNDEVDKVNTQKKRNSTSRTRAVVLNARKTRASMF